MAHLIKTKGEMFIDVITDIIRINILYIYQVCAGFLKNIFWMT